MAVLHPFPTNVRLISDGESVNAGVTNRPIQDLVDRTDFLKDLAYTAAAGQSVVYHDMPCVVGALVGDVVYLDSDDTLKPAIVNTGSDGFLAASSRPFGLIMSKPTSQICEVLGFGRTNSTNLAAWDASFDSGTAVAGPIYLSSITAGKITQYEGQAAVALGELTSTGELFFQPRAPYQGQHQHLEFVLVGDPAGTVADPGVGSPHVISSPNPAAAGWLPANATYFPSAVIPPTAKFGYNLQHAAAAGLLSVFPPVLTASATLIVDGAESPLAIIDGYGIWWTSDAYGQAPWPTDYVAGGIPPKTLLRFIKPGSGNQLASVTNLRADPSSPVPLQVLDDLSGNAGTVGRLRIRIPSTGLTIADDTGGDGTALRGLSGQSLLRSPVVNRLIAGPGITITASVGSSSNARGDVTVSASAATSTFFPAALQSLGSAVESTVNGLPSVQLAAGTNSTPTWLIPSTVLTRGMPTLRIEVVAGTDAPATIPFTVAAKYLVSSSFTTWTNAGITVRGSTGSFSGAYGAATTVDVLAGSPVGSFWTPGATYFIELTPSAPPSAPVANWNPGLAVKLSRNGATDGLAGSLHILSVSYLPG